jgi:uncharacterized protein DUF3883
VLKKLAVKRLTASDLTFFMWHFRNQPAGNQKAINLNADVFVNQLYPSLPETEQAKSGRIPLDLYIYGPGAQGELNIQRKIVKTSSYKNWRLNGEFVDDPEQPERFSPLANGDFVVFEFTGELLPTSAKAMFIARMLPEDSQLHMEFENVLRESKMIALDSAELSDLINRAGAADNHPINELTLDDALEDVALGGSQGAERLLHRRSGRKLTKAQLLRAKQRADEAGDQGEACVNSYLLQQLSEGLIRGFDWVSEENAIAPYDFRVLYQDFEVLIDAKSTSGGFERAIHISLSELREMSSAGQRYDIYRVFEMTDSEAQLRIARGMKEFASSILQLFDGLPGGVFADAVSVDPGSLPFEEPILIVLEEDSLEGPEIESLDLPV